MKHLKMRGCDTSQKPVLLRCGTLRLVWMRWLWNWIGGCPVLKGTRSRFLLRFDFSHSSDDALALCDGAVAERSLKAGVIGYAHAPAPSCFGAGRREASSLDWIAARTRCRVSERGSRPSRSWNTKSGSLAKTLPNLVGLMPVASMWRSTASRKRSISVIPYV